MLRECIIRVAKSMSLGRGVQSSLCGHIQLAPVEHLNGLTCQCLANREANCERRHQTKLFDRLFSTDWLARKESILES